MRILCIDYGARRIGLAVSNPEETMAVGAGVIEVRRGEDPLPAVAAAAAGRRPDRIVLGLPLNMDGSISNLSAAMQAFAARLQAETGIPVELWDERLSSAAAEEKLREVKMKRGRKRTQVNQVAAQVILESYLEARRTPGFNPKSAIQNPK
jgi:putative Holliday junction resolvase